MSERPPAYGNIWGHSDEMLEELRRERDRYRKALEEIRQIALDTDTRADLCCIAIHDRTFRALNPTEES